MKVDPLTPMIGATVQGIQLADVVQDDALFEAIHEQWMRHLVLFFRDQALNSQQHLSLGERFGSLHIHPAAPFVGHSPGLMKIHVDKDSKRNNGDPYVDAKIDTRRGSWTMKLLTKVLQPDRQIHCKI